MQASTNFPQIEYAEKDGSTWFKVPKDQNMVIMINPELYAAMIESYNMDTLRYYRSRYLLACKSGQPFNTEAITVKCVDGRAMIIDNEMRLANSANPRLFITQDAYHAKVFDSNRKTKVKVAPPKQTPVAQPFFPQVAGLSYSIQPPTPSTLSIPIVAVQSPSPLPVFNPSVTSSFVLPTGITKVEAEMDISEIP